MKKGIAILLIIFCAACASKLSNNYTANANDLVEIPDNPQQLGNAEKGYDYLINGNYIKSGLPYKLLSLMKLKDTNNLLHRSGDNANLPPDFTTIYGPNGIKAIAPNCLFCHAQKWEDTLVVGLGNSLSDYSKPSGFSMLMAEKMMAVTGSKSSQDLSANLITAAKATAPYIVTASKGVNIADRLTAVLAAHRDPESFVWHDKAKLKLPDEVIPTDVPAWWLLKKKNAMFYNGFGRGNFARFLMAANLLTVTDTAESVEVLTHFDDVMAYLYSIKAPKYPFPINSTLAQKGKALFTENCAQCHGTYGENETYPNLLISTAKIKTDPALVESNFSSPQFLDWFSKSWFAKGGRPAQLVPFKGYIAPPLDGVWCTAPYLHNASVPTIEALLNSKTRPKFWARNFEAPQYDYENLGWQYTTSDKQYTKSTYNTTLKGYGNGGHYFGDVLNDQERKAVLEYLKTL